MTAMMSEICEAPRTYAPGEIIDNPIYRTQEIASYRRNPFTEALPPILTQEQVMALIEYWPDYDEAQRHLPAHLRLHLIYDAIEFFQPLPLHLELEERVSRLIRQGYKRRNPLDAARMTDLRETARTMCVDVAAKISPVPLSSLGFVIVGTSGTGKTTALNAILSLYPQVIRHSWYDNRDFIRQQIVYLRLECPQDASLRGLCFSFFKAVDDLCKTREYTGHARNGRATVDEMIPAMADVARKYGIGLLVIDEMQNLSQARSGGAAMMLNFFVRLANEMNLPIILVGTPKVRHILGQELRQARRAAGQGDMTWERLEEAEIGEDGNAMEGAWHLFTDSLWRYQYVAHESELTAELRHALYEESQGIVDFAVKVYMLAQVRAIATGRERVTADMIRAVGKDSLQLARPMLTALRDRDIDKLMQIGDIDPIDIAAYIEAAKQQLRKRKRQRTQDNKLGGMAHATGQDEGSARGKPRDETTDGSERSVRTADDLPDQVIDDTDIQPATEYLMMSGESNGC